MRDGCALPRGRKKMIGLQIEELKDFTAKLFLKDTFDSFEVSEAEFITKYTVSIDGMLSEPEGGRKLAPWSAVRPLAFQIIKGKELPHSFRIVFRLSRENTEKTLASLSLPYDPDTVAGLFLNLRYDNGKITAVTGSSFTTFSMDRTLDREWDGVVRRFFRHHGIAVSDL